MKLIVIGGGAAGLAAALAAARKGVDVLLVEADSNVGGDLFSGMPLLGAYTTLGVPCVKGILPEIVNACENLAPGGIPGPVCDWRSVVGLCLDPEILRLVMLQMLAKYQVRMVLNTRITAVRHASGRLQQLLACSPVSQTWLDCDAAIDATGGGFLTKLCGGEVIFGSETGEFQPLSLTFRMGNIDYEAFLRFIRDNPEEALLCDNPALERDRHQAARNLYEKGYPYVALAAAGKLLGGAIERGEMHPCTAAFITPTSLPKRELCLNVTRVSGINCRDASQLTPVLYELNQQIIRTAAFFRENVPGFQHAAISAVMPRLGMRESGRIVGEYLLTQDDVIQARRFPDAIAKGSHHVDIHGRGTAQVRIPVRDGLSYDIPYGCLLPVNLANVMVAGRCLSSDRGANGSARVMGTCIATGQAAGCAATLLLKMQKKDFRELNPADFTLDLW
ncbi:MAG: FAD-dependent oxidoreductase [Lentisphaeria bacterium]